MKYTVTVCENKCLKAWWPLPCLQDPIPSVPIYLGSFKDFKEEALKNPEVKKEYEILSITLPKKTKAMKKHDSKMLKELQKVCGINSELITE